jgi:serine/threonine protein kinase
MAFMECRECGVTLAPSVKFCSECGARVPAAQDPATDPLKETLEKSIGFQYRIDRLLGRGGMGAVYLAHELALDRDVAIKVLPPDQAGAPQYRDRFKREARIAARLNHPYIVPLHTFGELDGLVYFVMGFVTGESLASRLHREERLDAEEARTLLVHMADALDYAHRQGVVHRDIKPDNILIDEASGFPMLTDFGIAKAPIGDTQLTTAGQFMGTPDYMSPEQVSGKHEVGPASDLYSLGIVGYQMLSGRLPFEAATPMDAMTQRLTQAPRPLRAAAPDLSDDLITAVNGCLHQEPAKRWPDAKSFRSALAATDDESDDGIPGRILRLGTGISLVTLLLLAYQAIFTLLKPDLRTPDAFKGMVFGLSLSGLAFLFIGSLRLKQQGLDARTILGKALQQPRWWRPWYPGWFRRRGDVWDRLPAPIRRFRILWAVLVAYIFGFFLPMFFGLGLLHLFPVFRIGVELGAFALMATLFTLRKRSVKEMAASLKISTTEASKLVGAQTWRTTVWQRGPAATLLRDTKPTRTITPPKPEGEGDQATRI